MLHKNLSINEAGHLTLAGMDTVELAKKYADEASPNFINGVLASIVKEKGLNKEG